MTSLHRIETFYWTQNPEPTITGYKIYAGRATGAYDAAGSPKDMGNNLSGTFTTDAEGLWYFALTSYTATEESNFSAEMAVQLPLPRGFIS